MALLSNFTSGELSPLMRGRVDIDRYHNGCELLRNMVVLPYGGVTRRPGTSVVAEVKQSNDYTRIIPFVFSSEQNYIIEMGHQYMRFYMDHGQILSNGSPYEISTPYTSAELSEIHYTQTADTMYIVHKNHPVHKLVRSGHTSWTLTEVNFLYGPFGDEASAQITPDKTSGSGIALSSATDIFAPSDVYRLIALLMNDSKWYYLKISSYSSSKLVYATIQGNDLPNTNPASKYKMGAWCSANGYPRTVTFFEQRLMFGGTNQYPQTIWGSQSGDYENMLAGSNDSDAVEFTIADDEVNAIVWMIPRESLLIGTTGGEARLGSSSLMEPLSPTNVTCRFPTNRGSSNVRPLRIGRSTLFVQRGGRTVREIAYRIDEDSYDAENISILSEHITRSGIIDAAYQQEPFSIAWFVRADGNFIGLTINKDQLVYGWHLHETAGKVESIAIIGGAGNEDELWMVVNRTIGGVTRRFVEYMMPFDFDDQKSAHYVDCGAIYSGQPTTTISGLGYLEGETVQVLVDGGAHADRTVTDGQIVLARPGSVVHVGLAYRSKIKTVNLDKADQTGTSVGQKKKVVECMVRFKDTQNVKVGRDQDHVETVPFMKFGDPLGVPLPLFTGDKRITVFRGDWSSDAYIYLEQDMPLPMTILCIVPIIVER